MSPEVVFALYRPKPGQEAALLDLVREHVPLLRRLSLATDSPSVVVQSKDGTLVEVFEWATSDASRRAHEHPEVARTWEAMAVVADFVRLQDLPEAKERFPHFRPRARTP